MRLKLTVWSPEPMASSSAASAICRLNRGRRSPTGCCGSTTTSTKSAENFCRLKRWMGWSGR